MFVSHVSLNKQGIHCLFYLIFKVNFIFIAAWHKYYLLTLHEPTCSLLVPLATADEGGDWIPWHLNALHNHREMGRVLMRNEFAVTVTFDTPLCIPLLSLYFQIVRFFMVGYGLRDRV